MRGCRRGDETSWSVRQWNNDTKGAQFRETPCMRQAIIPPEYTVTHHGHPVGVTDLRFARFDDRHRAGWFFPNCLSPAMAAAFDWHGQFNFQLRSPDGSIVPTEWIGIQDTERLLALAAEEKEEALEIDLDFEGAWTDEPGWLRAGDPDWTATERPDWMPDADCTELPRYQILVRLAAHASSVLTSLPAE
jgi:hypothetical protein